MIVNDSIPTIQISQVESNPDLDDVDDDTHCKYDINDAHTDIEDLDSDENEPIRRSPSRMLRIRRKAAPRRISDAGTDIEDYNASDSDSDESIEKEDGKFDLNEFLDLGFVEEVSSNNVNRVGGTKQAGPSFRSYLTARDEEDDGGITDCENLETSEDEETEPKAEIDEKPYDDILKEMLVDDGNSVNIQDSTSLANQCRSTGGSPSFFTDDSDSDEACPRKHRYKHSVIELISDDETRKCGDRALHSPSVWEAEEIVLQVSDNEETPMKDISYSDVGIAFMQNDRSKLRKRFNRPSQKKSSGASGSTLTVAKKTDEAFTDVENLDSSDEETSSLPNQLSIPAAVINSGSGGLTDVEDFDTDEDDSDSVPFSAKDIKLPSPIRELTLVKVDGNGVPITKVMPLNSSGVFLGVTEAYIDKGATDTEDLSGNEEDFYNSINYSANIDIPEFGEGGTVHNTENLTASTRNKCIDHSGNEPLTDVEEVFVGGERKRKPKPKNWRSRQFLDAGNVDDERAHTDVEELDVSDDQAKNFQCIRKISKIEVPHANRDGGITDTEDISGDENEFKNNPKDIDINVLKQEAYYSTFTCSDGTIKEQFTTNATENQLCAELSADTEILQFNSDTEDLLTIDGYSRADTVTPIEIRNALEETCNFSVFDHAANISDRSGEAAHVKGYREPQETHTDVEFFDDDTQCKSIIRFNF